MKRLPPSSVGTFFWMIAMPTVRLADGRRLGPVVQGRGEDLGRARGRVVDEQTTFPFQTAIARGLERLLGRLARDHGRDRPLREEERGDGRGVRDRAADRAAQVETTLVIERRDASSSSLRTAAAVAGVNVGILMIATSRSHFVLTAPAARSGRG